MLYGVVHEGDDFWVIDQWGDRHAPMCCASRCKNVATHCYGEGIGDLYCDEHDPQ